MTRRQIKAHTALRGIAALMVVGYHLQFGGGYRLWAEQATQIFHRSYLCVDLFFVLSGFVISYTNNGAREQPMGRHEFFSFIASRFSRIYPLHFFCLVMMLILLTMENQLFHFIGKEHLVHDLNYGNFFIQLLLLNAWIPDTGWNIASWSISAEMVAYFLFPVMVSIVAFRRFAGIGLLLLLSLTFYAYVAMTTGVLDIISGLAPLRCLAGFALGMLVYLSRDVWHRVPSPVLSLLQIAAVGWSAAVLATDLNDVLVIPPFMLVVASTWTDRGLLPKLLNWRIPLFLGEISYSIYLTHLVLILSLPWSLLEPQLGHGIGAFRAGYLLVMLAGIIVASTLTYTFVEKPARQWLLKRLFHRERPAIETVASAP